MQPMPPVEQFADQHGQSLLDFAYLTCRNADQAQDIVQTVLLRMSEKMGHIDYPLTYARRAIYNETASLHRRAARWTALMPRLWDAPDEPDHAERSADRTALSGALNSLSPRQRAVIILRFYEGLPDDEIAGAIDCAPATVRSIAARALKRLRATIETEE